MTTAPAIPDVDQAVDLEALGFTDIAIPCEYYLHRPAGHTGDADWIVHPIACCDATPAALTFCDACLLTLLHHPLCACPCCRQVFVPAAASIGSYQPLRNRVVS